MITKTKLKLKNISKTATKTKTKKISQNENHTDAVVSAAMGLVLMMSNTCRASSMVDSSLRSVQCILHQIKALVDNQSIVEKNFYLLEYNFKFTRPIKAIPSYFRHKCTYVQHTHTCTHKWIHAQLQSH